MQTRGACWGPSTPGRRRGLMRRCLFLYDKLSYAPDLFGTSSRALPSILNLASSMLRGLMCGMLAKGAVACASHPSMPDLLALPRWGIRLFCKGLCTAPHKPVLPAGARDREGANPGAQGGGCLGKADAQNGVPGRSGPCDRAQHDPAALQSFPGGCHPKQNTAV